MNWDNYRIPETVEEALKYLYEGQGSARVMAGGTDLMLMLQKGQVCSKTIVDLSRVKELRYIKEDQGKIRIGALATHSDLAGSELLKKKVKILAIAAGSVGSPQIRNVGTVGGNIVNAQPAADTAIALSALNASALIRGAQCQEERAVLEIHQGVGKCCIDPQKQILTEFSFDAPGKNEATTFMRHAKRKALALPILNLGLWLRMDDDRKIVEDIRIVVGPMGTTPLRAVQTEEVIKGSSVEEKTLKKAKATIGKEVNPRDSIRGSSSYKKEMAKVFLERAILEAFSDLGGAING